MEPVTKPWTDPISREREKNGTGGSEMTIIRSGQRTMTPRRC